MLRNWEKSVRLAAATLDEPIGSITDCQDRKASASNRARRTVNSTVFVVVGTQKITALINPIIRRHDAAVEYSASCYWHPHKGKEKN